MLLLSYIQILVYADSLVPTVRKALCDPLAEVRMAAAKTFDNLHQNIGQRALEDIIPPLLKRLVSIFLYFIKLLCSFFKLYNKSWRCTVEQWLVHLSANLEVAGSSPGLGKNFSLVLRLALSPGVCITL